MCFFFYQNVDSIVLTINILTLFFFFQNVTFFNFFIKISILYGFSYQNIDFLLLFSIQMLSFFWFFYQNVDCFVLFLSKLFFCLSLFFVEALVKTSGCARAAPSTLWELLSCYWKQIKIEIWWDVLVDFIFTHHMVNFVNSRVPYQNKKSCMFYELTC